MTFKSLYIWIYDTALGYAFLSGLWRKQKQLGLYHTAAISLLYLSSTTPATQWLLCDLEQAEGLPSSARCPDNMPTTSDYHSS